MVLQFINLTAVLVAAIASMVIGAVWYSPLLFGRMWMKASGVTEKKIGQMKKKGMAKSYLISFLSSLVMAYVLAYFVNYTGATTISEGARTGIWVWLGFIATMALSSVLWEGKSLQYYLINVTEHLVSLAVMGAILAVWV